MPTLIRKGRKKAEPEAGAAEATSTDMVAVDEAPAPAQAPAQAVAPYPPNMPRSYGSTAGYDYGSTYSPPGGAQDFQLPVRHYPSEPPPSPEPATGKGGLLSRVLLFTGEQTADERDRVAAQEFEQAIAPVMDYMRAAAPEASTPEEAARIWSENQGEITPDPQGGAYVPGDAFDADARVYYRLLRRGYERYPRPSERNTRKESHHLHQIYGKLSGNKGW